MCILWRLIINCSELVVDIKLVLFCFFYIKYLSLSSAELLIKTHVLLCLFKVFGFVFLSVHVM